MSSKCQQHFCSSTRLLMHRVGSIHTAGESPRAAWGDFVYRTAVDAAAAPKLQRICKRYFSEKAEVLGSSNCSGQWIMLVCGPVLMSQDGWER